MVRTPCPPSDPHIRPSVKYVDEYKTKQTLSRPPDGIFRIRTPMLKAKDMFYCDIVTRMLSMSAHVPKSLNMAHFESTIVIT